MAEKKIPFTIALFGVAFVTCVAVATLLGNNTAPQSELAYVSSSAPDTLPEAITAPQVLRADQFQPQIPPPVHQEPTQDPQIPQETGADLPLAPHLAQQAIPVTPSPTTAAPTATPQSQYVGMSPQQLALQLKGRTAISGVQTNHTPPPMALPDGIAQPTPLPSAAVPSPTSSYRPTMTNAYSTPPPAPSVGQDTAGSVDRLRASLQELATGEPQNTFSPSNTTEGWQPISMNPASGTSQPESTGRGALKIGGGKIEAATPMPSMPTSAPSSSQSSSNQTQQPTQTPILFAPSDYPAGSPPAASRDTPALPPAPQLPGPAIREEGSLPPLTPPSATTADSSTPESNDDSPELKIDESRLAGLPEKYATQLQGFVVPTVAAQVNDNVLSGDDAIKLAEAHAIMNGEDVNNDNRKLKSRIAAEEWAAIQTVAEEARSKGVVVAPQEIDRFAALRPGMDVIAWRKAANTAGIPPEGATAFLESIALTEKMVHDQFNEKFPEAEIQALYAKAPDKYPPARSFHVREIFKARGDTPEKNEEARKEAIRLQRQASTGTDFELLAIQASDAATKSKGGDMGWLDETSTIRESAARALINLQPGQISQVVEDDDGYRIYQLVDKKEPVPGFEGAKDTIVAEVKSGLRESLYQSAVKNHGVMLPEEKTKKVQASNAPASNRSKARSQPTSSDSSSSAQRDQQNASQQAYAQQAQQYYGQQGYAQNAVGQPGQIPQTAPQEIPRGFGAAIPGPAAGGNMAQPAAAPAETPASRNPFSFLRFRRPSSGPE